MGPGLEAAQEKVALSQWVGAELENGEYCKYWQCSAVCLLSPDNQRISLPESKNWSGPCEVCLGCLRHCFVSFPIRKSNLKTNLNLAVI